LRKAIDENLWLDIAGAYVLSEDMRGGFGRESNVIAILAGVTTSSHTSKQVLDSLKQLSTPAGPFAFSDGVIEQGIQNFIIPYASAHHLRAVFECKDDETVMQLLKSL
jgi:hypothetical protein